jgi:hypothetical protein
MTNLYYESTKDIPDGRLEQKFISGRREYVGWLLDEKPYPKGELETIFADFFCKYYQKCLQSIVPIEIYERDTNNVVYSGVIKTINSKKTLSPKFSIPQQKNISQMLNLIVRKAQNQAIPPALPQSPSLSPVGPRLGGVRRSKQRKNRKRTNKKRSMKNRSRKYRK